MLTLNNPLLVCSSPTRYLACNMYVFLFLQDHDGSHIKGLLINFIHTLWPSLLRIPSFLLEFITPIVKVCYLSLVCCYDSMKESNGHFVGLQWNDNQ